MMEWKKIEDVCNVITGGDAPLDCVKGQQNPTTTHPYPVFSNGDAVYGYSTSYKIASDAVTISSIGNVGSVNYRLAHFTPIIRLKVLVPNNDSLLTKYLYYALMDVKFIGTNSSLSSMKAADIKKMQIPIPSIAEQTRIVGILDTFTAAIDNLKQQIEQRRKQYEYYRDNLLDLEGKEGVEMRSLREVLKSLKTGLNPRKNFTLNAPCSKNYYITVRELSMFKVTPIDKTDKVTDEALVLINNRSNLEIGDVLFSGTGTIGRTALVEEKPTNWNIKEGVYTLKPLKDIIDSRYLIQLLHSKYTIEKMSALIVGDPIRSIPMKSLITITIPVPSLSEQQRIVTILDTFEESISNLEQQLRLREKQYKYYRNKLLTFE